MKISHLGLDGMRYFSLTAKQKADQRFMAQNFRRACGIPQKIKAVGPPPLEAMPVLEKKCSFVAYLTGPYAGKEYLNTYGLHRNEKVLLEPGGGYDLQEFSTWKQFWDFCQVRGLKSENYLLEELGVD